MKQYRDEIWVDEQADGTINIGFSQSFINRKMAECFHVIQADTRKVEADGPLLVIESNDMLESLKSPTTGKVIYFNSKARNFPDKLTEEDVIISVMPPKADPRVQREVVRPLDQWYNDLGFNIDDLGGAR